MALAVSQEVFLGWKCLQFYSILTHSYLQIRMQIVLMENEISKRKRNVAARLKGYFTLQLFISTKIS